MHIIALTAVWGRLEGSFGFGGPKCSGSCGATGTLVPCESDMVMTCTGLSLHLRRDEADLSSLVVFTWSIQWGQSAIPMGMSCCMP